MDRRPMQLDVLLRPFAVFHRNLFHLVQNIEAIDHMTKDRVFSV